MSRKKLSVALFALSLSLCGWLQEKSPRYYPTTPSADGCANAGSQIRSGSSLLYGRTHLDHSGSKRHAELGRRECRFG